MGYNNVIKVKKGDNVYGETRERGAGIRPNVG